MPDGVSGTDRDYSNRHHSLLDKGNISVTINTNDKDVGRVCRGERQVTLCRWFNGLDAKAAARVATAMYRLEQGNLSNAKSVGKGVSELRIDFGPGYRIYFGQRGGTLIILLGGGTKQRQSRDIALAQQRWADYKRRSRSTGK